MYRYRNQLVINETPKCLSQDEESETNKKEKIGNYSIFLFYFPALCDVTATSIMYIALTLTSASSFQMLRGSIMIFVGNSNCHIDISVNHNSKIKIYAMIYNIIHHNY